MNDSLLHTPIASTSILSAVKLFESSAADALNCDPVKLRYWIIEDAPPFNNDGTADHCTTRSSGRNLIEAIVDFMDDGHAWSLNVTSDINNIVEWGDEGFGIDEVNNLEMIHLNEDGMIDDSLPLFLWIAERIIGLKIGKTKVTC